MAIDLSIVIAVYNEDPRNLDSMLERLSRALSTTGFTFEVVFVNDGSNAVTSHALRQLVVENEHVKVIELSRNFGQQAAITAGMDHSRGRAVVNIDSDGQDPPELMPQMLKCWQDGYDVVYAQRSTRRDRLGKQFTAFLFYRILSMISSVDIPWDTGDYRLLDRKVVDALKSLPEKTRFLRGMIPWLGFKQIGIPIARDAREVGKSSYTFRRLLRLAVDGLISFSVAPLYIVPIMGAVLVAVSAVAAIFWLSMQPFAHSTVWLEALVLLLVFLTGVQICATGLVAVYLSKTLDEARARPTYVISERLGTSLIDDNRQPGSERYVSTQSGKYNS